MFSFTEVEESCSPPFWETFVSQILVVLISWYQKHLSPIKGFSCAHRVLHNEESCSQYVKRMFLEQDLLTAVSQSRERFKACSLANQTLLLEEANLLQAELMGRRKFVYGGTMGFVFPFLAKGSMKGRCGCFDGCGGSSNQPSNQAGNQKVN